jgi:hypothetical protein
MSDAIKVGDLVQIVRARECCPQHTAWGLIYTVTKIKTTVYKCCFCDTRYNNNNPSTMVWGEGTIGASPHRLKRIPPLDELEGQRTEEDLREPA